jgi:transcriptional regulator with XRE-family HTH domain
MTVIDHPQPKPINFACLPTSKTINALVRNDDCVPTSKDPWPQDEFLAWLDAIRDRKLKVSNDLQLAGRLGIGHSLISNWRNGRQRPSMDTLTKVARAVGEDPRRLWVLAGVADASDVGLDNDSPPAVQRQIPVELEQLADALDDPRLDKRDHADALGAVRLIAAGMRAAAAQRDKPQPGSGPSPRRAG